MHTRRTTGRHRGANRHTAVAMADGDGAVAPGDGDTAIATADGDGIVAAGDRTAGTTPAREAR